MSKELEVLLRIEETINVGLKDQVFFEGLGVTVNLDKEALLNDVNYIREALKRNEPMKVIFTRIGNDITGISWDEPTCPKCKSLVSDAEKFCSECEQKLDWGKYK